VQTKQTVRPAWMEKALAEAWTESKRRISESKQAKQLEVYAEDPVGFCTSMFGETYTDDTIKIFESVRDNPVTIARSANAVGKTFTAARIAVFFYRVFDDAKVYLTAAPPLDNLRRILWGEIMSIVRKQPKLPINDTRDGILKVGRQLGFLIRASVKAMKFISPYDTRHTMVMIGTI